MTDLSDPGRKTLTFHVVVASRGVSIRSLVTDLWNCRTCSDDVVCWERKLDTFETAIYS